MPCITFTNLFLWYNFTLFKIRIFVNFFLFKLLRFDTNAIFRSYLFEIVAFPLPFSLFLLQVSFFKLLRVNFLKPLMNLFLKFLFPLTFSRYFQSFKFVLNEKKKMLVIQYSFIFAKHTRFYLGCWWFPRKIVTLNKTHKLSKWVVLKSKFGQPAIHSFRPIWMIQWYVLL